MICSEYARYVLLFVLTSSYSYSSISLFPSLLLALQTLDDGHFLHAHMMGMLAAGYLENGLLVDAEEVGARAVERTGGRDVWALHTLLSCLQLAGRSSEGKNISI